MTDCSLKEIVTETKLTTPGNVNKIFIEYIKVMQPSHGNDIPTDRRHNFHSDPCKER